MDASRKKNVASRWDVPLVIQEVVEFFLDRGVSPWLVGGIVRDYFLKGEWGDDWDFELHTSTSLQDAEWESYLESLSHDFSEFLTKSTHIESFESEELSFKVFRFILRGKERTYDVELSGPRLEIYPTREDLIYSHCDFDVRFDSALKASESFKRRDFTVNAMAFGFLREDNELKFEVIDPFGGEQDLKQRVLRPCDQEQFYYDPVRALRSIRFQQKLQFELRDLDFGRFQLEKLSTHYVLEEGKKSQKANFFQEFFQVVNTHRLEIPASVKKLSALVYLEKPFRDGLASIVDLVANCEKTGLSFERMEKVGAVLGIKKKTVKSLIELKKCAPAWRHFDIEALKTKWRGRALAEILKDPFFQHLKRMAPGLRTYLDYVDQYPELKELFPLGTAKELRPLVVQDSNDDFSHRHKAEVEKMLERESLENRWYQYIDWYLRVCPEAK